MDRKKTHHEHLLNYCFSALQYIGEIDNKLLKRAQEYAEDSTGVHVDSFELLDDDEIDEDDDLSFKDEEDEEDEEDE